MVWHVLVEPKVYITTCRSFSFLHSYDEKNRQKLSITYVIKCPVYSTILLCGDAKMLHWNVGSDEIDVQYTLNV